MWDLRPKVDLADGEHSPCVRCASTKAKPTLGTSNALCPVSEQATLSVSAFPSTFSYSFTPQCYLFPTCFSGLPTHRFFHGSQMCKCRGRSWIERKVFVPCSLWTCEESGSGEKPRLAIVVGIPARRAHTWLRFPKLQTDRKKERKHRKPKQCSSVNINLTSDWLTTWIWVSYLFRKKQIRKPTHSIASKRPGLAQGGGELGNG